jgi:DNA-binding transcriptional ArsR family regulator
MVDERRSPDAAQWLSALNHPLRRSILRILEEREVASATDLARLTEMKLGNVAYHVNVLTDLETLELVRRRQVRGAFEKFYRAAATTGDLVWVGDVLERTRKSDPHP